MKIHAGYEPHNGLHLTACGRLLRPEQAPLSQPVNNITCRACRRTILNSIEATKREVLGMLMSGRDPFKTLGKEG